MLNIIPMVLDVLPYPSYAPRLIAIIVIAVVVVVAVLLIVRALKKRK